MNGKMTKQTPAPYFHIEDFVAIGNVTYRVSTVDLSHGGTVVPLNEYRWETMVFRIEGKFGWYPSVYARRYTSEAQARVCHTRIVEKLVAGELDLEGVI